MTNCTPSQLEGLYRPLIQDDLSPMQEILKHAINKQIKQRTSMRKMIYSVFAGKRKEYTKLKEIKNSIADTSKSVKRNTDQTTQDSITNKEHTEQIQTVTTERITETID